MCRCEGLQVIEVLVCRRTLLPAQKFACGPQLHVNEDKEGAEQDRVVNVGRKEQYTRSPSSDAALLSKSRKQ